MNHEDLVASLRSTQRPIFEAIREHGPQSDGQLIERLNTTSSKLGPRRVELVRMGLLREVDRVLGPDGKRHVVVWGIVPADELELAREAASRKPPRRKSVASLPLETRVAVVKALLRDAAVNQALLADEDRSAERARARARDEARRTRKEQRERAEQIRRAERVDSERALFMKAVDVVKKNVELVRNLGDMLDNEVDRGAVDHHYAVGVGLWQLLEGLLDEAVDVATAVRSKVALQTGSHSDSDDPDVIESQMVLEVVALLGAEPDARTGTAR